MKFEGQVTMKKGKVVQRIDEEIKQNEFLRFAACEGMAEWENGVANENEKVEWNGVSWLRRSGSA